MSVQIAIDGPSGAGKSTMAKMLSKELGFLYLDTGAMYRSFALYAIKKGVKIEDYVSGKAKVKILKIDEEKDVSRIEIIIHEGKNREVRKMCNAIGKKVLALHRSRIGNLNVKDLKIGEWKYLNNKQIESLIK